MNSNRKINIISILILLATLVQSAPDTTICPKGYSITRANMCDIVLGPCATTDYDASVPTFATTCLSCFDDAELFTIFRFNVYGKSCVPKVCTDVNDAFSASPGMCRGCLTGFTLTANRSCAANAGIILQPTTSTTTATNTTNTTTPANATNTTTPVNTTNTTNTTTPTNTTNATTPANTTTPTNSTNSTTTPTPTNTTPTTSVNANSNTVGSQTSNINSKDFVTASIIITMGAVFCVMMWIIFKIVQQIKFKSNHQQVQPDESFKELKEETLKEDNVKTQNEIKEAKHRRRAIKERTYDQQQLSFTQMDEIIVQ